MGQTSEEYAIVLVPGAERPQVLPTRGRHLDELEAFCATSGAAVIRICPSLEAARRAISAFAAERPAESGHPLSMKLSIATDC